MKKNELFARLAFCIGILAMASLAAAQSAGGVVAGRYIVELKSTAAPSKVISAHAVAPDLVFTSAIKGFAGFIPPGQLRALEKDSAVASIVPDRVVMAIGTLGKPNKPAPGPQAQVVPAGVARIGANPAGSILTGLGIGVAVVDTGLDFNHADLPVAGAAYSFTAYGTSAQDDEGHGTHVGGIIAARNNTIGVVGVAPDATLYAVKVLDRNGSGTDSTIIAGLDWIHANAAGVYPAIRVVNMSLGRQGSLNDDPALRAAIKSLYDDDITVVVAAGNDSLSEVSQQVPATYPEVLAIASATALTGASKYRPYPAGIAADTASYFTTDGGFDTSTGIGVTISAPGEDKEDISRAGMIQSVGILSTKLGGGTVRMSGTSMAAPHVSGVVARAAEAELPGSVGVETIRSMIMDHALNVGVAPYDSPTWGYTFDGQREGIVAVPELWGAQ